MTLDTPRVPAPGDVIHQPPLNGRYGWSWQSLLLMAVLAIQMLGLYLVQRSLEVIVDIQADLGRAQAAAAQAAHLEHEKMADVTEGVIYMLSLPAEGRPGVIKPKSIRRLELQAATDHYLEGEWPLHAPPLREYRKRERADK